MPPRLRRRAVLLGAGALTLGRRAMALDTIRIAQATTSLSFLPIWAARALDTFTAQNLALNWVAVPGGDPSALAALDSGDVDLAAVGSDTLLAAVAKGQPFQAVSTIMGRVSLDLVVSATTLKKAGISPSDPLDRRLGVLAGATVGVSAVGGAQDRAVRWLAAQGHVPSSALRIALAGGPPALQAALENGRIDAFILSPPEGQLAEAAGSGRRLVSMSSDFPQLTSVPFLVLVAKTPVADPARVQRTLRALVAADAAVLADGPKVSDAIGQKFFPKIAPEVIRAAVAAMQPGIVDKGALDQARAAAALRFAQEAGVDIGAVAPTAFWTSAYIDAALHG